MGCMGLILNLGKNKGYDIDNIVVQQRPSMSKLQISKTGTNLQILWKIADDFWIKELEYILGYLYALHIKCG